MPGEKARNPLLGLVVSAAALALLIGLPFVMEPPETTQELLVTAAAGLVLVAIVAAGAISFIRSRRPRPFLDSMLPPQKKREEPITRLGDK